MSLLELNNLKVQFKIPNGKVYAVNDLSFSLEEGESIGIVGESGSGKSVSMLSVMKLLPSPPICEIKGSVKFMGKELLSLNNNEMSNIRGREIAMIYQNPNNTLNPVIRIGNQITETLDRHLKINKKEAKLKALKLLKNVGIQDPHNRVNEYAFQFSGGMCQRTMIAIALSCNPKILIADEPTTALDVTIQSQIVDLVKRLKYENRMSVIWITHDLSVISGIADKVIVMYGGTIVEVAPVDTLYYNPSHPYTKKLLVSIPRLDIISEKLEYIPGVPPNMEVEPVNCPFYKRCDFKIDRCYQEKPKLRSIGNNHLIACWVDIEKEKNGK